MLNCMQCGKPVERLKSDPDHPSTTFFGCSKCNAVWEVKGSDFTQRSNISLSEWKDRKKKQQEKEQKQKEHQEQVKRIASGPMV